LADLPDDVFLEDGEEQYDVIATLGDEFLGPEPARNNYQPLTPCMPEVCQGGVCLFVVLVCFCADVSRAAVAEKPHLDAASASPAVRRRFPGRCR
jgi:hypothetical protein